MILRAAEKIGRDNTFGVGLFEAAKEDDMIKYGLHYYKGDVFKWLNTSKHDKDIELIFIDSFGGMDFWAKALLEYLNVKYPNAVIIFLAQSRFHNRRMDEDKLEKDCITYWGLNVTDNLKDFIHNAETIYGKVMKIVWTEDDEDGQPVSLVRVD